VPFLITSIPLDHTLLLERHSSLGTDKLLCCFRKGPGRGVGASPFDCPLEDGASSNHRYASASLSLLLLDVYSSRMNLLIFHWPIDDRMTV
jgi:hypothetical protein